MEVTTGPLGQGIANAVGLAVAEAHLAAHFNTPDYKVVDNMTYVFCGDGCLQEGVASEAASLAGHLGLGKLVVLWDDNKITIDGSTDLSFTEDVLARFASYGWHTQAVEDGDADSSASLHTAMDAARAETGKPSIIAVRTTIGFGSKLEGTQKVHGAPLKPEDLAAVKSKFGFDPEATFAVKDSVKALYAAAAKVGEDAADAWDAMFAKYAAAEPAKAAEWTRRAAGQLPEGWKAKLPTFTPADKALATRKLSEGVINALEESMTELMGGSADLTGSNLTLMKTTGNFLKETPEGRNVWFGVREHAMAAVCNGMHAYGLLRPYCATFLNFVGYALGAIRLSALSHHNVIYVMTHDSIGLGEDGPTHQPIATLTQLRSMPQMLTFRPADGNEVSGCYAAALEDSERPSTLALSRQGLPQLEGSCAYSGPSYFSRVPLLTPHSA